MSSFLLKHYKSLYLLLPVLLGLALGHLAATGVGIYLSPPLQGTSVKPVQIPAQARKPTLPEYQGIVARNIFDSTAKPSVVLTPEETPEESAAAAAPVPKVNLSLLGTVTRGERSLAVIRSDAGVRTYRLGAEVPGGGTLASVERNTAQIRYADGSSQTLSLRPEEGAGAPSSRVPAARPAAPAAKASPESSGNGIRPIGENRWAIPQHVAEQSRGNLNELLKQARMEPNIVDGQTQGFVVRMIQPRSLLAMLGIQRGDVVRQINGIELDSPEKALQIFQQLREARSISISLQRGGSNLNFEYEVE